MKLIGISGGSGTGKSTLSERLLELLPNSLLITMDRILADESHKQENTILEKLGVIKVKNVDSSNHYHFSEHSIKTWINITEPYVISRCEDIIKTEGQGKDYILLDWCFLPLCSNTFNKCDTTICVTADYNTRLERLIQRLKDPNTPETYEVYKPGIIEKRVELTALNERGFTFNHYVENNGSLEDYYYNIDKLIKKIMLDFEK